MSRKPADRFCLLVSSLIAIATAANLATAEPQALEQSRGLTADIGEEALGLGGLGVNIHFTDPRPGEMEMLSAGGFRWVRMDFGWGNTERRRGQYDFSAYDRLLAALEKHRIRALLILDYSNNLYEADRSVATQQGRQAYARWAAAAAKHFRGHGIVWEIWNEPNIRVFWQPQPNVDDYTAMALAAAQAIRKAAPGEAIIGPATSTIDLQFLEACFKAGLLEWWDAVSVHPYRQSPPETAAAEYDALRRLIARYAPAGKKIPIISGEWGYSAAWNGFDADTQGKMLPREWLTNLGNGVPISIWYDWHDDGRDPREPEHHFGTVSNEYHDGRSPVYDPKPAYLAAKTLTSSLAGCRFTKRLATANPDDYAMLFSNRDRLCVAAWTIAAEPHEIQIPSNDGRFEVVSYLGERRDPVSARDGLLTMTVSDAPAYLTYLPDNGQNQVLADAPAAHPLRVTLAPGPGKMLIVEIDNLADTAFHGMARLVDLAGIDAVASRQPLDLAAGQAQQSLRFPLAAKPAGECRVGLRIEDEAGRATFVLPTRKIVLLPDELLTKCRVVADGDSKVASQFSLAAAAAPRPLADADVPTMKITYRFGDGWSFLRLVPQDSELNKIAGRPKGFGFWIYGDRQRTSPRLRVRDATGQTWQPSGRAIDWEGWRYVEIPLDRSAGHWGGAQDGTIHFPLQWDSFFLLDNPTRQQERGEIYIAAVAVVY